MRSSALRRLTLGSDQLVAALQRARYGDSESINSIIEMVQDRLLRFCFHLSGDRQQAEDLCQETFIKAFAQLDTLNEDWLFVNWTMKIAKNIFLDQCKLKRAKKESLRESMEELQYSSRNPIRVGESDPSVAIEVRETLQQLKAEDRIALLLVDMEGHSYSEAASMMDLTEPALRSRLSRARSLFLQLYEKR